MEVKTRDIGTALITMSELVAKLEISRDGVPLKTFPLTDGTVTMGRAPDNVLALTKDQTVSRHHARITHTSAGYVLCDLGSGDGTYVNEVQLTPHLPHSLVEDDQIKIGSFEFRFRLAAAQGRQSSPNSFANEETEVLTGLGPPPGSSTVPSQQLDLQGRHTFRIGRDPLNEMEISHPVVSRFHAEIKLRQGSHVLSDLDSRNGTFVNGQAITGSHVLRVGDTIRIGPARLIFNPDETLVKTNEEGNLSLDALHLNKRIGHSVNLLNDISLSIRAREFVVIAGVSGGGKSTLLDALNGFRPATSGMVLVNGTNLYRNFNAYRSEIGYVPQRDIVHMELTVEQALEFAARLRMPADTNRAERKARIYEVLQELGLEHRRHVPIRSLSGGQIKRISIGVELLTKPSLFFLDEATSGLDPGTEGELMQLLRELADQGRTILLVTHATENVTLCDQVVFMAQGGNLAFFGPPLQAPNYFGVERFNQIYRKVDQELSPEQWQQQYLVSPQFQKYVTTRQQAIVRTASSEGAQPPHQPPPGAQVKRISSWRQFLILSQRNLAILLRDRTSLILMLAVAPILGLLDFFAWPQRIFDTTEGSVNTVITMLFITTLIAVMVGSLSTMREIVKEQDIYRRERIIGLQIVPYVLSKVWVGVLLALYQAAIFLLFKVLTVDIPTASDVLLKVYVTLVLITIGGMMMGLLASALSPNQNVTPLIVLILLVPQILFGGSLLPINTLGPAGKVLNQMTLTKWPFEALITITGWGQDVANDPCWALSEQDRKELSEKDKEKCPCLGPSLFETCEFPGIGVSYSPEINQPAPVKPEAPATPRPRPQQSSPAEVLQYQTELDTYLDEMSEYQTALDQWQQQYSVWKEQNQGAIGTAEAMINKTNNNYGKALNVDLARYWLIMGLSSLFMLVFIFFIQKIKDIL